MTDLPNRGLVVYVLSLLGGDTKKVHTEDIAIECHKRYPTAFSWTKYPELPDKDIVRVALTDARKAKYGGLVKGRSGQTRGQSSATGRAPSLDGWVLTPEGISWLRENAELFAPSDEEDEQLREHRQKALRNLKRIKDSSLYERYEAAPDEFRATVGEVAELLRCRVDAPVEIWEQRLEQLERLVESADQPEMLAFVAECRSAYDQQQL